MPILTLDHLSLYTKWTTDVCCSSDPWEDFPLALFVRDTLCETILMLLVPTGHPGTSVSWLQGNPCVVTRASRVVLVVKNMPTNAGRCKRHQFDPWVGKIPWRRAWQPTPVSMPGESHGLEPGRLQSIGSHRVGHD